MIIGMINKMLFLSNPKFHQKNFELIDNILLNNDYSLEFIFNIMSQRIKHFIKNSNIMNKDNKKNMASNNKIWCTIPFVNNILDEFKRIINMASKIAFYS